MREVGLYECDGGSLLVGNENARVAISNRYGDGVFNIMVFDRDENKRQILPKKYDFIAEICGKEINIYGYDCLCEEELGTNILFTLSGRYGVYCYKGNMYLEKWD